jgi:hypothetical protein
MLNLYFQHIDNITVKSSVKLEMTSYSSTLVLLYLEQLSNAICAFKPSFLGSSCQQVKEANDLEKKTIAG